jgi:hypothetical protein
MTDDPLFLLANTALFLLALGIGFGVGGIVTAIVSYGECRCCEKKEKTS